MINKILLLLAFGLTANLLAAQSSCCNPIGLSHFEKLRKTNEDDQEDILLEWCFEFFGQDERKYKDITFIRRHYAKCKKTEGLHYFYNESIVDLPGNEWVYWTYDRLNYLNIKKRVKENCDKEEDFTGKKYNCQGNQFEFLIMRDEDLGKTKYGITIVGN